MRALVNRGTDMNRRSFCSLCGESVKEGLSLNLQNGLLGVMMTN